MELLFAVVVLVALAFTFMNGFHDMGVTLGNVVAARALEPRVAVWLAVVFNFVGALVGQSLAEVFARYVVDFPPDAVDTMAIIIAGLLGGLVVNIVTYVMAIPVSSTHCLIGGLLGAGIVFGAHIDEAAFGTQVLAPLLVAPVIAFAFSFVLMAVLARLAGTAAPKHLFRTARKVDSVLVGGLALAHGVQSAQKSAALVMIAWYAIETGGADEVPESFTVSWWVRISVALVLALGTGLSGWRVARTVSVRMVRMDPVRAVVSDITSATYLLSAAFFHALPTSQSYTVVAANLGTQFIGPRTTIRIRYLLPTAAMWLLCIPVCGVLGAVFAGPMLLLD
ncbi:inorganic phosphate transporter [Brevibacterium samyangense]|uniref:Inorganic phosphate transporter n=1 Tax=Brevibacterium samyangense TaxID=366888 RepID=A0ABN2TQH6_9MICO